MQVLELPSVVAAISEMLLRTRLTTQKVHPVGGEREVYVVVQSVGGEREVFTELVEWQSDSGK